MSKVTNQDTVEIAGALKQGFLAKAQESVRFLIQSEGTTVQQFIELMSQEEFKWMHPHLLMNPAVSGKEVAAKYTPEAAPEAPAPAPAPATKESAPQKEEKQVGPSIAFSPEQRKAQRALIFKTVASQKKGVTTGDIFTVVSAKFPNMQKRHFSEMVKEMISDSNIRARIPKGKRERIFTVGKSPL